MKKFILFFIFTIILGTSVYAEPIKKYEEVIPLSPKVTLTKVSEFRSDRNLSYSYIKADLTAKNTGFRLFSSAEGTDILDTVPNLVKDKEDVIAAINADFFSVFSGSKGFSLGIQIEDGVLKQSPINPTTMATVAYADDEITMSYLDFHIMAVAPNWEYAEIRHLNKHTTYYGDILMYTKDFNGGMSPAPGGEVVEVVVEDGKIKEFRRNMPPVEIPEDGCVLVVSEGSTMFFANNFAEGDEIRFDYYFTPDISEAETAFGAGAMLVENGEAVPTFSHVVAGNHPRSALGVDKDGTTLYIVAVDGRQDSSLGLSMSRLAQLMLELGCHNAVNLDGGGSTNMVASTMWKEDIHTVNSPTENRKVINAIGLTYSAKKGEPKNIDIKADSEAVFIGHPVKISTALYDKNMRPVAEDVEVSSIYGTVEDNIYIPETSGETIVKAKYDDLSAKTEIYVVEKISGIDTEPYIRLNTGESKTLDINVFDNEGHYVAVTDTKLFDILSSDEDIVSVSGNKVTAHSAGNAIITIQKDGVCSYISVVAEDNTDEEELKFTAAPENIYADSGDMSGHKIVIGAVNKKADTLLKALINGRIKSAIANEENSFLIGEESKFSNYETDNALYINVDTAKGSVRSADEAQWTKIDGAIRSTDKDNIFIFSENSVFDGTEFGFRAITDYFAETGKNVFVITGGNSNSYKNIKGVHYFTLGYEDDVRLNADFVSQCKSLVLHFGETVTFEWVPCF